MFSEKSTPARDDLLDKCDERTLRSLIITAPFEALRRNRLRKPEFLFGDTTIKTGKQLHAGKEEWHYISGREAHYLPTCQRHYPLKCFVVTTKQRRMK